MPDDLPDEHIKAAIELRHELHARPELSGCEENTAALIRSFFEPLGPDATFGQLGGHGVGFAFEGDQPGPTVMLRCELDALPIHEASSVPHASQHPGLCHACGHDGHMSIVAACGLMLARRRPACGRVILLYQPSEENGRGAAAVLSDPSFDSLAPDFIYALHNLPGLPKRCVALRPGVIACASRGIRIELRGETAHAAYPETGRSPAVSMCELMAEINALPDRFASRSELVLATVVSATLGEAEAFGSAPGSARVLATVRCESADTMRCLVEHIESAAEDAAARHGLDVDVTHHDVFEPTVNAPEAIEVVRQAAIETGLRPIDFDEPLRFSEDFGQFTARYTGAFVGLGAGEDAVPLHNATYDFDDELIEHGARLLGRVLVQHLGVSDGDNR